jgi:hypothetical protein
MKFYEFLAPDQEYLEAMVKQAIYETYLHLKDLEKKEYFIQ